ncbi:hypothetical protein TMatcc_009697 [Talaromyces marneffei ATCC 18224]|uniref:DUF7580 domain-containing protein n=1 Tax=Talaromyces marneffei (strain ATCC 18224 / CBS 334.59 / QM 7333) TaxID=441960 RepID=B6QSZ9_TALMQ|nr:conserved hypothetical protein [Talaromyces marneffei ATCC 18224]
MSGMEFVGLVLAILPLVANQLDNYSRGIETVKGLRQYRWELENYSSNLSAQYAIFLNTLQIFLQDVVDDHDQRSELIKNPTGNAWKDTQLQAALTDKLGRDYHAFFGTMAGLCSLLEELSNKLNRRTPDYSKAVSLKSLGTLKFRKILSKAVYEDILDKIDRSNQILRTLTEQSRQIDKTKKVLPRRKDGLKRHRDGRRHARALYNILVQGQGWKCSCKDNHTVCFRIDTNTIHNSKTADEIRKTRFLLMISAARKIRQTYSGEEWHEVELQPELIENTISVNIPETSMSISKGKRKVQFAPICTTICVEAVHKAPVHQIDDLCYTLGSFSPDVHEDTIGYIFNHPDDEQYHMRLLRKVDQDVNLCSLQDILSGSNSLATPVHGSDELSRRDRLYLAVILACGVLQLYGSWLKRQWGTKDVLFAQDSHQGFTNFEHPYLVWRISDSSNYGSAITSTTTRIYNEILLPLAIALIELSLGKTISALYRFEDHGPTEREMHFNTATRVLRLVYCESGTNYGDVVKQCLYWPRDKGERFEDPQFDESIFDTVVSPLLKDFDYFEGVSQMH